MQIEIGQRDRMAHALRTRLFMRSHRSRIACSSMLSALSVAACSGGTDPGDPVVAPNADSAAAPSCAPWLSVGAVTDYERALLDTIAFTEGTAGHGEDGYNVTFDYHYFSSCDRYPDIEVCAGGNCSTAAGRYQFLEDSWDEMGLPSFHPDDQDRGAMKTITHKRGVSVPPDRALTGDEFKAAMDVLSYEWASLPPSRYGQHAYSLSETRTMYCSFAGCDDQVGSDTGTGTGASTCSDQEMANSRYGDGFMWTCEGNHKFICKANGEKTVVRCRWGCEGRGVGANDVCHTP
jgi:muramidase (phage lysozyme)